MRRELLALAGLTLLGCGAASTGGTDASAGDDLGSNGNRDLAGSLPDFTGGASQDATVGPADLLVGAYPPGPYGAQEGDTMAPLVWEGYVDPAADVIATSKPYVGYSLDEMRKSGAPYGLVHISEYY